VRARSSGLWRALHASAGRKDAGERRPASDTDLLPGDDRFHVVSTNTEGDWNEAGDVSDVPIRPAVYQTRAFKAAVGAAALLAAWGARQLRSRRVQRQFQLVLAERLRIGREIHDTLLQSLVGVALEFDDISEQLDPSATALREQVQRIRAQVEHCIRETRSSIWDLRSPTFETDDLPAALQRVGEAAVSGSSMCLEFVVSGTPRRAEVGVGQQLLRIAQEALSNAVRHSNASKVSVHLAYEADSVRLRVSDDGRGFDPSRTMPDDVHWGVTGMHERAEQIGAELRLITSPGGGTQVVMSAKLHP
jgi:signal transduction histidine kinase